MLRERQVKEADVGLLRTDHLKAVGNTLGSNCKRQGEKYKEEERCSHKAKSRAVSIAIPAYTH